MKQFKVSDSDTREHFTDLKEPIEVSLPSGDYIAVQDGEVIFSGLGDRVGISEWELVEFVEIWMRERIMQKYGWEEKK